MMKHTAMFLMPLAALLVSVSASGSQCGLTPATLEQDYFTSCKERLDNDYYCKGIAWKAFSESFAGKRPEDITESDYERYYNVLPIVSSPDQSLFWSGTFELAGLVSCMCPTGANLVSSSNTPSSAIINDIGEFNWCGNKEGIDYENPCLCDVTSKFWNKFSIEFASVAKGTIFYLGYGERDGGAFRDTSSFARFEIPNMEYPRVTAAVVLNVHRKGKGEACGEGTLIDLQNLLESKQFEYSCYNIYGDLNDDKQSTYLSMCASHVVRAIQKDNDPFPLPCFSPQKSDQDEPSNPIFDLIKKFMNTHW